MNRRRLWAAGSVALAIAVAGGAVAWSTTSGVRHPGDRVTGPPSDVGIAGPLGPQQITAFPSYFKRVTFANNELGQSQVISAHLPPGEYLVEVLTPNTPSSARPDCMGVSFPLVPPADVGMSFRGFVTVAKAGDAASVSCYVRATNATSTVTYELFYIPAMPAPPAP
jgi:hypothetical protein